jgi:hypothetical protein
MGCSFQGFLPAGTPLDGKSMKSALARNDKTWADYIIKVSLAMVGILTINDRSWEETALPRSRPEALGFEAGLPKAAVLLGLYPGDAKLGGLLREAVDEVDFRAELQHARRPDHRAQDADYSGMCRFFE